MLIVNVHYPELSKLSTDRLWELYSATMKQLERCYKLFVEYNCCESAMNVYEEYKDVLINEIDSRRSSVLE